jgi:hypothetical protein
MQGVARDLNQHYKEQRGFHTQLMRQTMKRIEQAMDTRIKTLTQQNSELKTEHNQIAVGITRLQAGFTEMALMVQMLQATSYDGVFIWRIPDIRRRRREAVIGQMDPLHSAPFYSGRHGYKLCLSLQPSRDGCGLEFFVTIMRGEYDAILPWPFRQKIMLAMIPQGGHGSSHVRVSCRPDPRSLSFQRPRSEMNIASGCPMLISLDILSHPSYVKDDTLFIKCEVKGLKYNHDF